MENRFEWSESEFEPRDFGVYGVFYFKSNASSRKRAIEHNPTFYIEFLIFIVGLLLVYLTFS